MSLTPEIVRSAYFDDYVASLPEDEVLFEYNSDPDHADGELPTALFWKREGELIFTGTCTTEEEVIENCDHYIRTLKSIIDCMNQYNADADNDDEVSDLTPLTDEIERWESREITHEGANMKPHDVFIGRIIYADDNDVLQEYGFSSIVHYDRAKFARWTNTRPNLYVGCKYAICLSYDGESFDIGDAPATLKVRFMSNGVEKNEEFSLSYFKTAAFEDEVNRVREAWEYDWLDKHAEPETETDEEEEAVLERMDAECDVAFDADHIKKTFDEYAWTALDASESVEILSVSVEDR